MHCEAAERVVRVFGPAEAREAAVTPHTLHPTPYTLHPTPPLSLHTTPPLSRNDWLCLVAALSLSRSRCLYLPLSPRLPNPRPVVRVFEPAEAREATVTPRPETPNPQHSTLNTQH